MSLLSTVYNLLFLGRLRDDPGPFDPGQVQKILVVRNDNIGDVICTTPALDALRRAFPRAQIDALVCTLTEEAIAGHRALDRVWAYPKVKHKQYGKLRSLLMLGKTQAAIRRQGYDLAISLRVKFSSSQAWLSYTSGARWRLGPEARGKKSRWGFFYNLPAPWPPKGRHEVERCFSLLSQIQVDSADKTLYLKVPKRPLAMDFLAKSGIGHPPGPVVVNITRWAYRPDRHWPADNYRGLITGLGKMGLPVVVSCAPADADWVSGLLQGLDPKPPCFWSPSIKEFAGLASLARVFVTIEGGPMHLAAAVGAPLVVLWAKASLEVWRPWSEPQIILGDGGAVSEITVDQVVRAVARLADSQEPGGLRGDEEGSHGA